jgi:Flp pilus assembly protein CpaB
LAAGLAVLLGLAALERDTTLTPVVVAAREIPGGTALSEEDLELAWFSGANVPDQSFDDISEAAGFTTAITVSQRSPITGPALTESGKLVGEGMVALPVSFSGVTELLQVGDHIDIIGPDEVTGAAKVLAGEVRIVAIPDVSGGVFSSGAQVLLIEVPPDTAAVINSAASISALSFALR